MAAGAGRRVAAGEGEGGGEGLTWPESRTTRVGRSRGWRGRQRRRRDERREAARASDRGGTSGAMGGAAREEAGGGTGGAVDFGSLTASFCSARAPDLAKFGVDL